MMRRFNKKGEDMLVDFWAILIFAIIVLLFFIIFSASKATSNNTITQEFESKDVNFMLDSFLRAPAQEGSADGKTVAEVIAEDSAAGNGDFKNTQILFENFFQRTNTMNAISQDDMNNINDINLEIDGYDSKSINLMKTGGVDSFTKSSLLSAGVVIDKSYSAQVIIPGYGQDVKVTLRLSQIPYTGVTASSKTPSVLTPAAGGEKAPVLTTGH